MMAIIQTMAVKTSSRLRRAYHVFSIMCVAWSITAGVIITMKVIGTTDTQRTIGGQAFCFFLTISLLVIDQRTTWLR